MPRTKNLPFHCYIDPKYKDKLLYLKYTSSITKFVEKSLDNLVVDDRKMDIVRQFEQEKEG